MKYTLQQLEHLRNIRLKGFEKDEMLDDNYTNEYNDFEYNTSIFLKWLQKMEESNKITFLLEQNEN